MNHKNSKKSLEEVSGSNPTKTTLTETGAKARLPKSKSLSETAVEQEPEARIPDALLILHGTEGEVPYNQSLKGDMLITPENCATFSKEPVIHRELNPLIFHGKYINCRLKKNGNYQMTSAISRDTISKWTDANGKVNLTEIYRYLQAELQRTLIIIEKRHTLVPVNSAADDGKEANRA